MEILYWSGLHIFHYICTKTESDMWRIFLKIVVALIALVVILLLFFGVIVWWSNHQPLLPEGYYLQTPSGGELESRYVGQGAYDVEQMIFEVEDKVMRHLTVYCPKDRYEHFPLVLIVNGSNMPASRYLPFFSRLASWGFVVVGCEDPMAGRGDSTSAMLDYLLAAAEDSTHPLYELLDTTKIGVAGFSQGGAGAIRAVTEFANSDRYTTLFTCSAASCEISDALNWSYDPHKIQIPYFMVAGTGTSDAGDGKQEGWVGVTPLASLQYNFDAMPDNVTRCMARCIGAEHGQMQMRSDSYLTAWMLYWLRGENDAWNVFSQFDGEIFNNALWQDGVLYEADTEDFSQAE